MTTAEAAGGPDGTRGTARGRTLRSRTRKDPDAETALLDRAVDAVVTVARHTAHLVVPIVCPCGTEGALPCAACMTHLDVAPVRVDARCEALQVFRGTGPDGGAVFGSAVRVLALGEHAGVLRRLVLAWKNGGQLRLTAPLAHALVPGAAVLVQDPGSTSATAGTVLVPVPSSLAHRLRRGEDHTVMLARAIGRETGLPALRAVGLGAGTQSGKGARERRRGRAVRVRVAGGGRMGRRAILVDDVVTTGSTLRAVAGALEDAGWEVCGALVVSAARLPLATQVPGHRDEPDRC